MRLRNKLFEWFWFALLMLPLFVAFLYAFNSKGTISYTEIVDCINSFLPFGNQLSESFSGVLDFFGVSEDFTICIGFVCYFVFLQFLRVCAEFILILVEIAQHFIDKACLR